MRQCGDCTLCCKLLPVQDNEPWRNAPALDKPAGVRCPHQRHTGCTIYKTAMPFCCKMWNCRWLVNDDMGDQSRPDRSHLVVDIMPDYITAVQDGVTHTVQVAQVWCDPKYPDAHRDPAFRRYLRRLGNKGIAAIIRFNSKDCLTIFPPQLCADGQWHEATGASEGEHTIEEKIAAMGGKIEIGLEGR
jgi:hypothetical protein